MAAVYEQMIAEMTPEKLEQYKGDYETAYRNLGVYYAGLKDNVKAKECFGKFLELEPNNTQIKEIYDSL